MGSRIQSAVFVSHSPSPTFVDSRPAPNTARSTHPAVPATTARPTDATPTTLPILHKSFRISGHERCSDGVSPPAAATLHIGHAHVCEPPRVPQQIFRRCLRPGTPSPHHCSHCRPEKRERQRRSAGPEGAAAKMLCSLLEELLRLHLPTPPMTRQLQQLRKAQLGRPVPPTTTAPSLATSRSPKAWILLPGGAAGGDATGGYRRASAPAAGAAARQRRYRQQQQQSGHGVQPWVSGGAASQYPGWGAGAAAAWAAASRQVEPRRPNWPSIVPAVVIQQPLRQTVRYLLCIQHSLKLLTGLFFYENFVI